MLGLEDCVDVFGWSHQDGWQVGCMCYLCMMDGMCPLGKRAEISLIHRPSHREDTTCCALPVRLDPGRSFPVGGALLTTLNTCSCWIFPTRLNNRKSGVQSSVTSRIPQQGLNGMSAVMQVVLNLHCHCFQAHAPLFPDAFGSKQ